MSISKISINLGRIVGSYVDLTKPRIISLLIFTAITGTVVASEFELSIPAFIATALGGILTAGGASALNVALETDLDEQMARTRKRPVTSARISRRHAILFGIAMNLVGFIVILVLTNILAASLAIIGSILYVGLYTLILKRTTTNNIVIGGAAGSVPPLVGYASVNGELSLSAWYLFALIFFWTPPHFWALALLIKDDYAKAKVPMLPVVKGHRITVLQILLYSLVLAGLAISFSVVNSFLNLTYLIGSIILSAIFIALAALLTLSYSRKRALGLYLFSLVYLFLLFGLIMVDVRLSWLGVV